MQWEQEVRTAVLLLEELLEVIPLELELLVVVEMVPVEHVLAQVLFSVVLVVLLVFV